MRRLSGRGREPLLGHERSRSVPWRPSVLSVRAVGLVCVLFLHLLVLLLLRDGLACHPQHHGLQRSDGLGLLHQPFLLLLRVLCGVWSDVCKAHAATRLSVAPVASVLLHPAVISGLVIVVTVLPRVAATAAVALAAAVLLHLHRRSLDPRNGKLGVGAVDATSWDPVQSQDLRRRGSGRAAGRLLPRR